MVELLVQVEGLVLLQQKLVLSYVGKEQLLRNVLPTTVQEVGILQHLCAVGVHSEPGKDEHQEFEQCGISLVFWFDFHQEFEALVGRLRLHETVGLECHPEKVFVVSLKL
jgi:hypothetical protein